MILFCVGVLFVKLVGWWFVFSFSVFCIFSVMFGVIWLLSGWLLLLLGIFVIGEIVIGICVVNVFLLFDWVFVVINVIGSLKFFVKLCGGISISFFNLEIELLGFSVFLNI